MGVDYYLGLDIGTDSVGWAVTDENYQIIKRKGKALWGVRLFDSAKTAEERRSYRTARRRIERRKQRLGWLQEQFSCEVAKKDPGFFIRLCESKFLEEDKIGDFPMGKHILFSDSNYCDKDYYRQYPTIYHLRKALIENPGPFDVRLVYLAIHHIMKNRGHFLYGDLDVGSISLDSGFRRLNRAMEAEFDTAFIQPDMMQLREILISRTDKIRQRKKRLAEIFKLSKEDEIFQAIADLLAGAKVSLDAIFGEGTANDEPKKISLEDDFGEIEDRLTAMLGDRMELILAAKEIYDWALLETMRNGEKYLSSAMVKIYEKHEKDLKLLKETVKSLGAPALYKEIFHESREKLNNYTAYSGKDAKNSRCGYEDFKKYLSAALKTWKGNKEVEYILLQLEQGDFLPKQVSKNNGVIPHQLHEMELVKILENASKYLPFLLEKDQSGLTKAQQIHKMFCFRIPYYVGPLDSRSEHSWVVRSNETIYPWNFEQVVDLEACRQNFIRRMTAKCSYIGEDVLPKSSLLYSKYMVLNIINKLKINGRGITVEQKQGIYRDLFLSGKKVSAAKLRNYLQLERSDELGGFDGEIKADLAPWKHFDWLLKRPGGYEAAEDIILHLTLFGEDRSLLRKWISRKYGTILSADEQKQALSFRCSGWGRLSKIFLTELYHTDSNTGEVFSLMDMLWNTNLNLMELLGSQYSFGEEVSKYRRKAAGEMGKNLNAYLEESYASPAIKRSIHQTIAIVSELQGILKAAPKRIFVEMAREQGEKGKRTISRKSALMELYKKCGEDSSPLFQALSDEAEGNLRRDKLYLYYTQLGKCMYSGEPIELSNLDSGYDIDHIYPQSKTKDDSINNRVLVKRELNAAKSDQYPLAKHIRQKMRPFWMSLESKGLITKEKLERLVRSTDFTLEEQAGFIARQLVETRQSCKVVAELLQRRFGEQTEIVYVKAGNVSSFRQDQRLTEDGKQLQAGSCKALRTVQDPLFVKCREINDFHHAKDAYLNIVVGNVYHVKFTKNPANFLRQREAKYSLNRMFDFDLSRNGETAWICGETGSIETVRRMMAKNNILLTRRAAEESGDLFDQQIVSQGKGQTPVKSSDPRMASGHYGQYNKLKGAFFCLVEHTEKKKRVRSLEAVYRMYRDLYLNDPKRYCCEVLSLKEPKIIIPRIKINSLISYNGFRMHISGRTGSRIILKNANPLVLDPLWSQYVKNISKYLERCAAAKQDLEITRFDGIAKEDNVSLYNELKSKLENSLYVIKYETVSKTLAESEYDFQKLSCSDQCRVLIQILNLFANNASSADLKLLNGKSGVGILLISKNIAPAKNGRLGLIHQSVTGFFEQQVDLMSYERP